MQGALGGPLGCPASDQEAVLAAEASPCPCPSCLSCGVACRASPRLQAPAAPGRDMPRRARRGNGLSGIRLTTRGKPSVSRARGSSSSLESRLLRKEFKDTEAQQVP